MFFSSVKEINRLISKGMSNIYLKVTFAKNCRSRNFDFLIFKKVVSRSVLRSSNSRRQISVRPWAQNCVWLFYYFDYERNYEALKLKSPCILLNKNINFDKNETKSRMENPIKVSKRRIFCFVS